MNVNWQVVAVMRYCLHQKSSGHDCSLTRRQSLACVGTIPARVKVGASQSKAKASTRVPALRKGSRYWPLELGA